MAMFFDEWLHMNFLKGMGGQLKTKIAAWEIFACSLERLKYVL
jgi:hypothetical protein